MRSTTLFLKMSLFTAILLAILIALLMLPYTTLANVAYIDRAAFIKDVTLPDNSQVNAGESFEKVWRLKNSGTSTWTTSYSVVFIEGDRLGAPKS